MRPSSVPFLQDDLNIEGLIPALKAQAVSLEEKNYMMVFGERLINSRDYARAIYKIIDIWDRHHDREVLLSYIKENFIFLEVYGQNKWGEVHLTAYFEPVIEGSLSPSERFSQALYKKPEDLVVIDLEDFDPKYSDDRKMRGKIANGRLKPYYSREEISLKGVLAGRGLEICWVDPIDGFFLQIQGSGTIVLDDGSELVLNYAEKNGHPYRAIGRFIRKYYPDQKIDLERIETFLRQQDFNKMHYYLNLNPSYVFFRIAEQNAVTSSGLPATSGRTIATDKRFFPEGAIAYLEFPDPDIEDKKIRRIVLDQDTGGAIKGGGRVDLFWGRGYSAKYVAGRINHNGRLLYLFPST